MNIVNGTMDHKYTNELAELNAAYVYSNVDIGRIETNGL